MIDTGPQKPGILSQALMVTDDLVVPVAPSPVELEQLPDTFALAAEVDAISPSSPGCCWSRSAPAPGHRWKHALT